MSERGKKVRRDALANGHKPNEAERTEWQRVAAAQDGAAASAADERGRWYVAWHKAARPWFGTGRAALCAAVPMALQIMTGGHNKRNSLV